MSKKIGIFPAQLNTLVPVTTSDVHEKKPFGSLGRYGGYFFGLGIKEVKPNSPFGIPKGGHDFLQGLEMLRVLNKPVKRIQRGIVCQLKRGVGNTVNILVFVFSKEAWHCQHDGSKDVKARYSSYKFSKTSDHIKRFSRAHLPIMHHSLSLRISKYIGCSVCLVFIDSDFLDNPNRSQVAEDPFCLYGKPTNTFKDVGQ